jgi:hypothetical protein
MALGDGSGGLTGRVAASGNAVEQTVKFPVAHGLRFLPWRLLAEYLVQGRDEDPIELGIYAPPGPSGVCHTTGTEPRDPPVYPMDALIDGRTMGRADRMAFGHALFRVIPEI